MDLKITIFLSLLTASRAQIKRRVIGGRDTKAGQFPSLVSLQELHRNPIRPRHFCGGSIIDRLWILTAAQCSAIIGTKFPLTAVIIRAGKRNIRMDEPQEQWRTIESVYTHPRYLGLGTIGPFDIGLVKLVRSLQYNKYVSAISLPKKKRYPRGSVTFAGWGATYLGDEKRGKETTILQAATVEIIDREMCRDAAMKIFEKGGKRFWLSFVSETHICTGPLNGEISVCPGDFGGALIQKKSFGYKRIVGIMSHIADTSDQEGNPMIFVQVSAFIDWIKHITTKH